MTDGVAEEVVLYEVDGPVATVTMNRPEYRNAQNSAMTYALDAAFTRAVDDDEVKVIVLAGAAPASRARSSSTRSTRGPTPPPASTTWASSFSGRP